MSPSVAVFAVWGFMALTMLGLWGVQRGLREADLVDLGWTAGLGLAALFYAAVVEPGTPLRRWLVAAMVLVWAGRLCALLVPRVASRGEDGRYRALRERWGERAQLRFFWFFQLQGFSVALLSAHFLIAMSAPGAGLRAWDVVGIAIWVVAIAGEWIADRQLQRFRSDPANRGRVCRVGLWRYSRHPNYFFEWVHWLAYVPIAVGSAWAPLSAVAPIVMLLLITFVTGIPPAEAQAVKSRGEAYRRYQRTTSPLIPWFPKEGAP